jgi:hypothetical protein
MDAMKLIIDEQICELRREAKANRLLRVVSDDYEQPRQPAWPTRARLWLGDTLVAAGETLRSSADERATESVINRAA